MEDPAETEQYVDESKSLRFVIQHGGIHDGTVLANLRATDRFGVGVSISGEELGLRPIFHQANHRAEGLCMCESPPRPSSIRARSTKH